MWEKQNKTKGNGAEKMSPMITLPYCLEFPDHSAGRGNPNLPRVLHELKREN